MKIIKKKVFHYRIRIQYQNHENNENLIIPRQKHENHGITKNQRQNHENIENLIIPCKNN